MIFYNIKIQIGYFVIAIETENIHFFQRLENRFSRFLSCDSNSNGTIRLVLTKDWNKDPWVEPTLTKGFDYWELKASGIIGKIRYKEFIAEYQISPARSMQEVDHIIRIASAFWVFESGGILVHGAALVRNGNGYLFTGHSGAGKSTVCKVTKDGLVLNDDLVILKESEFGWEVWATPFTNPKQNIPNPGKAKLKAIINLEQAKRHRVILENEAISLADLITHIPVVSSCPENTQNLMDQCHNILNKVKAYRLYFLPDDQFWPLIPD